MRFHISFPPTCDLQIVTLMPARVPRVAGLRPAFIARYHGDASSARGLSHCSFKVHGVRRLDRQRHATINPAMIVNRITLVPYRTRNFGRSLVFALLESKEKAGAPGRRIGILRPRAVIIR